jgi:Flp pilus assembly protein TadD
MSPRVAGLAALLALAACASAPPLPPAAVPAPLTAATPAQMVAAIRAAGASGEGELAVQPLRDPQVGDLHAGAARAEAEGRHADAAAALDAALAVAPEDPALLQERAELAVLLGDLAEAERLALRAHELGARVGPLCRRHWATVEQARLAAGDAAAAAAARERIAACRVQGPTRY